MIAVSTAPFAFERKYRVLVGALARSRGTRRGRWMLAVGSGAVVVVLVLLAARHFATTSWPLSNGHPALLVAAGLLLLIAHALKAYGWGRLFASNERPKLLALAAGNGGAALIGVVLPGRFDDAMRVAVVRRYRPCPACVRALCLSLVMLGLIDSAALAPLAFTAAVASTGGNGVRAGLAVVAVGGVAAAALIVAAPHLMRSQRAARFRLGRWLAPRTISVRRATQAWVLVSACWLMRAAALPIGPAGAATQVGAGTAALLASGVATSQALSVAVSVGVLGILSGAMIFLVAVAWRTGLALAPNRAAAFTFLRRRMAVAVRFG